MSKAGHTASAHVPTALGARYVQQLAKHWAHNLAVTFDGDAAAICFPATARGADWPGDAIITLRPDEAGIGCTIAASHPEQLDGLKTALARHLDRFAFREAPLSFAWTAG
jgi:uncharacterized protein